MLGEVGTWNLHLTAVASVRCSSELCQILGSTRLPHKTARSALQVGMGIGGKFKVFQVLKGPVSRQADLPDSRGRTALHVAARKGLSEHASELYAFQYPKSGGKVKT